MRKIFIVDCEKCTGCMQCVYACSYFKEGIFSPIRSRIQIIRNEKLGINFPIICQHCTEPVCKDVCPVNAIYIDEKSGAVLHNQDICIGCRSCFHVCPFGAIQINIDNKKVMKCDFCNAEPECVKACTYGAIECFDADKASLDNRKKKIKRIADIHNDMSIITLLEE